MIKPKNSTPKTCQKPPGSKPLGSEGFIISFLEAKFSSLWVLIYANDDRVVILSITDLVIVYLPVVHSVVDNARFIIDSKRSSRNQSLISDQLAFL